MYALGYGLTRAADRTAVPVAGASMSGARLVRHPVRLRQPGRERPPPLVAEEADELDRAFRGQARHVLVESSIVETRGRRVRPRPGEVDGSEPRPVDRPEAHRAGLAARVERATI